jgi:pimeloyl-ACP methyl ester carboxylesterase
MKKTKKALKIILGLIIFIIVLPFLFQGTKGKVDINDISSENSKFLEVKGISIHYKDYLIQDTTNIRGTVVFVHGFGGSTFSFRDNIDVLIKSGYRVILVDLPGFGLSERTLKADYSNMGRAKLLIDFSEKLSLKGPLNWVGHSMGGTIISNIPLIDEEKGKTLVLIDAPYGNRRSNSILVRVFTLSPVKKYLEGFMSRFITEDRIDNLLSGAFGRPITKEEREGYYWPLKVKDTHLTYIGLTRDSGKDEPQDYGKVKVPVLIIWGENDTWVPIENGHKWNKILPNSRLEIIPDSGHNPMETHVEEFNRLILDFFEQLY